ncbi:MAG: DUF2784 domain-containing protein [Cytophagales bacterium]|nr:DUF2784 domain-containing protein [Cytophagales bacterium]
MLKLLDLLFLWLHVMIIFFNLFGWVWRKTRRMHLAVAATTLFSWVILGMKYGMGYCFLTDWHWEIKYKLGEAGLPASFVEYFLENYINVEVSSKMIDWITGASFAMAIVVSLYLNFFSDKKTRS